MLVDFWAEWCGPCKMIAPVLAELATEYDGKVKIGKVNIDEYQQLAINYGINRSPRCSSSRTARSPIKSSGCEQARLEDQLRPRARLTRERHTARAEALLFTPGQLASRSELFHQLGQVTASGIGLIAALEILQRNPPRLRCARPSGDCSNNYAEGSSFGDSLERSGRWLSSFDVALLQAGEKSGRLPDCFRLLASYYDRRAQLARQVIAFSAYPVVVFHVAVLIFPVKRLTELVLKGAVVHFRFPKAVRALADLRPRLLSQRMRCKRRTRNIGAPRWNAYWRACQSSVKPGAAYPSRASPLRSKHCSMPV